MPGQISAGLPLSYQLGGEAPDASLGLQFTLHARTGTVPTDLEIDPTTAEITWDSPVEGDYDLYIEISDPSNPLTASIDIDWELSVVPASEISIPPTIQDTPQGQVASIGDTFTFDFQVDDADQPQGIAHEFAIVPGSPGAITPEGGFSWTPTADDSGLKTFQISVSDAPIGDADPNVIFLTFQLTAIENEAPEIQPEGQFQVELGTTFVHQSRSE